MGIRGRIIEERSDTPACVFCKHAEPTRYCTGHADQGGAEQLVCEPFCPIRDLIFDARITSQVSSLCF